MPNKLLGQNFLKNTVVIDKIVAAIDAQKDETIIEVGPGHGALTIPLLKVCQSSGAKFIAIEKDPQLFEKIKREVGRDNFEIIRDDILEFNFSKLKGPFKIVGNIPYYLTGHLLRIVSELEIGPTRCVFMVQKEVAERMVAVPPNMNRLAASVQFWAEPKIIVTVPKKDFSPIPKVDSAVVLLERKKQSAFSDAANYFSAVRVLFAQPRKTILNNLIDGLGLVAKDKEGVVFKLDTLGIVSSDRPQNLSIEQIAEVGRMFMAGK